MPQLAERLLARTPARLRPLTTVLIRTARGAAADRLPGLAAEVAFWVLLSLPALLVTVIAATTLAADVSGGGQLQEQLVGRTLEVARVALTEPTIDDVLEPLLRSLIDSSGIGVVSLGFVTAVWTASRAVKVLLTATAIVYDQADPRKGWQDRLLGFAVTLGALVVGAVLAPLLLAGPGFGEQLDEWIAGDLDLLVTVWRVGYWPTTLVIATMALAALYQVGVPGRLAWRHDLPGAALATGGWLVGSAGLRLYGAWILDGESVYGPMAGPIVVLLWLWLTGFVVLLGAQLNAVLAHLRHPPPAQIQGRRS